jgi:DNA-binding SARP family transcriptional activator
VGKPDIKTGENLMQIKVLGQLEARLNGVPITPTASKPRQLLALLGLHAGQVVTMQALIEELWGTTPPRSAVTTLQTYVLRVRRRIEAAAAHPPAKDVLATRYGGYLLDVPADSVDVAAFEHAAKAGRQALDAGWLEEASLLLGEALSVWRGPVLADVKIGSRLAEEVARLEESRLGMQETRIDVDLRLGRHRTLLGELSLLTAQHPMNENFHALHMIALHRSGRQWRALEEYRALHERMVDRLGLVPSERLRRLQAAILHSDPILDVPVENAIPTLAS